jgi:citrate lyase subunit beta/citryl-CoA lyase
MDSNMKADVPVWRSQLFVPVNVEKFLIKAPERGADAIILDLEDSIVASDKDSARAMIADAVAYLLKAGGTDIIVRINQPLDLAVRDVESSIIEGVSALIVTKVEGPDHLRLIDDLVSRLEIKRGLEPGRIRLMGLIETPLALFNAREIALATPRLMSLSLGAEDYATAIGGRPTEDVLYVPKQTVIQAAKAAGIVTMGTIGTLANFRDLDAYRGMVRRSVAFGFAGASCIHPAQVPILNEEFSPTDQEIKQAQRIVDENRLAASQGRGSFQVDGQMIDVPVVQRAETLLRRAKAIEMRSR